MNCTIRNAAKARFKLVSDWTAALLSAFYNWIFNVQMITVSNRDVHGFNLYEYQASPANRKTEYLVTFRHMRNGHQVDYWVARYPAQDWNTMKERLIASGRYAY